MARRRSSNKRRKTGRPSGPPSMRVSVTPPPADTKPAKTEASGDGAEEGAKDKPKARAFFDVGLEDADEKQGDRSAPEQDTEHEPSEDAKGSPHDPEGDEPGSEPSDDDTSDGEPSSAEGQLAKSKDEGEDEPDQDERDSDAGDEASGDDGLHDDFFRKGEEVDKEHIAAHAQAAKDPPKLEDTGQSRLVALRSSPEVIERRNKYRKVVGYVLGAAAIVAAIAGYKSLNGNGNGSARAQQPVATVTVKPASSPAGEARFEPVASATSLSENVDASSETVDAETESAGSETDAAPEATTTAADAGEVASETDVASEVPDGVDARKEALKALNTAKWDRAVAMSRAAISKEPEDATLYLYQGTALQEMGKRDEAKAVFKSCVEKAKRGPINECRMFAR